MTIASNYLRETAIGTTATVRVDIHWDFTSNSELNVWLKRNSDDVYRYHRLGDFTIRVDEAGQYVDVENNFSPEEITAYVTRVTPQSQLYDLINGHSLDPAALEAALDKAIKLIQEINLGTALGETSYITSIDPFEIVNATLRADTLILFDSNGDPTYVAVEDLDGYYKLKVSDDDTTPGFLEAKTDSSQFETLNPAGAEYRSVKDAGLTIAKTDGLQAALDLKAASTWVTAFFVPKDLSGEAVKVPLVGTESVPIDDNGTFKATTIDAILAYVNAAINPGQYVTEDLSGYTPKPSLTGGEVVFIDDTTGKSTTIDDIVDYLVDGDSAYRMSFDDTDLTAGVLSVNHSLDREFVGVAVYDDGNTVILPDEATLVDVDNLTIDLSSYGTITGTWNLVVLSGGGSGGGHGEVNTNSNAGGGAELVKAKAGVDTPIRTIGSFADTLTVTQNADNISIDVSGRVIMVADATTARLLSSANDMGKIVRMTSASPITVTIPPGAFSQGSTVIIRASGTGTVTIQAGTGVTINGVTAGSVVIDGQYKDVMLSFTSSVGVEAIGALV